MGRSPIRSSKFKSQLCPGSRQPSSLVHRARISCAWTPAKTSMTNGSPSSLLGPRLRVWSRHFSLRTPPYLLQVPVTGVEEGEGEAHPPGTWWSPLGYLYLHILHSPILCNMSVLTEPPPSNRAKNKGGGGVACPNAV